MQHLKQSNWVLQSSQPAWRSSAHDAGRWAILFRGRRQGRQPLNVHHRYDMIWLHCNDIVILLGIRKRGCYIATTQGDWRRIAKTHFLTTHHDWRRIVTTHSLMTSCPDDACDWGRVPTTQSLTTHLTGNVSLSSSSHARGAWGNREIICGIRLHLEAECCTPARGTNESVPLHIKNKYKYILKYLRILVTNTNNLYK